MPLPSIYLVFRHTEAISLYLTLHDRQRMPPRVPWTSLRLWPPMHLQWCIFQFRMLSLSATLLINHRYSINMCFGVSIVKFYCNNFRTGLMGFYAVLGTYIRTLVHTSIVLAGFKYNSLYWPQIQQVSFLCHNVHSTPLHDRPKGLRSVVHILMCLCAWVSKAASRLLQSTPLL